MMDALSFPQTNLALKREGKGVKVLCQVRKIWVKLTPEEWVRQHVIGYLITNKNYGTGFISVEKSIDYHGLTKRWDVLVYDSEGKAQLLIECKKTSVACSKETLMQLSTYQHIINARKIALTNGLDCFVLDKEWKNGIEYL